MTRIGLHKGLCIAAILTATFGLVGMGQAEALRRPVTLGEVMESDMLRTRKVEVIGKVFDICVNMAEKVITVRGLVEDWDQMEQVKDYFNQRGPSDYQVICELGFAGTGDY